MKTVEELFHEVLASETLKKEFLALRPEEIEAFAAGHGCEAKLDEIRAFFEAQQNKTGELSDDELDLVAGGRGANDWEALLSILTLGTGCAFRALESLTQGRTGSDIKGEYLICEMDPPKKTN